MPNLNQRIEKLKTLLPRMAEARQRREESDRSGEKNLARIQKHAEGPAMLERFFQLAPTLEPKAILASPEACELSCRLFEIVATGDYFRLPAAGTL
jgi:hypothetical protein